MLCTERIGRELQLRGPKDFLRIALLALGLGIIAGAIASAGAGLLSLMQIWAELAGIALGVVLLLAWWPLRIGRATSAVARHDLCPTCNGAGGQRIVRRWYEGGEPEYESISIFQSQRAIRVGPTNEHVETEPAEHVEALEQLHVPHERRTVVLCSTCRGTGVA